MYSLFVDNKFLKDVIHDEEDARYTAKTLSKYGHTHVTIYCNQLPVCSYANGKEQREVGIAV